MAYSHTEAQHIDRLTRFFLRIKRPYTNDLTTEEEALAAAIYLNERACRTGSAGVTVTEIMAAWPKVPPVPSLAESSQASEVTP